MEQNNILADVQERIEKEALEKFPIQWHSVQHSQYCDTNEYARHLYIAGATAEAERAQKLVDVLEALIEFHGPTMVNWPLIKNAKEALQQWKDRKEEGHG